MYVRSISVLSLVEGFLDGLRVRDLALVAAALVGLLGLLVWQSYRQSRRRVNNDNAAPAPDRPAALPPEMRSGLSTLVSLACGISEADDQSRQEYLATGSNSAKLEFDVRLLVEHGTRRLASQAESKGLRFTTAVAANVPQSVRGDAAAIAVAFTNLLDNAVKFTNEGAVRLEVTVTRDDRSRPNLRFIVYDTGAGIDPETLGRVLEPGPADRRGLPVVGELVARMGGTMGAESEPRGGSTFWFSVPVEMLAWTAPASPQHPPPAAHSACTRRGPLLSGASRAGHRVLIVENDPAGQVAALWGVRALGYYGEVVSDGGSGVEAFQHTPFDLVLLDSTSPDFVETVERIRRLETGCIPVVLMHSRGADQPPARIEGVDGELAKPLCLLELAGTLEQWLGAAGPAHTSEARSDRFNLPV